MYSLKRWGNIPHSEGNDVATSQTARETMLMLRSVFPNQMINRFEDIVLQIYMTPNSLFFY